MGLSYMAFIMLRSFCASLLESFFYHILVLNFVKGFLCIYRDDHVAFIFQFVNMAYHTDSFAHVEESLYPWDILCIPLKPPPASPRHPSPPL